MISAEYSEAITEVVDILNHMKKEDTDKIPEKFKKFLWQNQSTSYQPQLDHTKPLKDMNLKEKTKNILAVIYSHYWCNDEKKIEFKKLLQENERKYQEEIRRKYDPDNLFKKKEERNKEKNTFEELSIGIQTKDGIWTTIINFIKGIFKGRKNS